MELADKQIERAAKLYEEFCTRHNLNMSAEGELMGYLIQIGTMELESLSGNSEKETAPQKKFKAVAQQGYWFEAINGCESIEDENNLALEISNLIAKSEVKKELPKDLDQRLRDTLSCFERKSSTVNEAVSELKILFNAQIKEKLRTDKEGYDFSVFKNSPFNPDKPFPTNE